MFVHFKMIITHFKIKIKNKYLCHSLDNILTSNYDTWSIRSKFKHNRVNKLFRTNTLLGM